MAKRKKRCYCCEELKATTRLRVNPFDGVAYLKCYGCQVALNKGYRRAKAAGELKVQAPVPHSKHRLFDNGPEWLDDEPGVRTW